MSCEGAPIKRRPPAMATILGHSGQSLNSSVWRKPVASIFSASMRVPAGLAWRTDNTMSQARRATIATMSGARIGCLVATIHDDGVESARASLAVPHPGITRRSSTGLSIFFSCRGPRGSNTTSRRWPTTWRTSPEIHTSPGEQMDSIRAAILTVSPNRSSFSAMTSPKWMPIRSVSPGGLDHPLLVPAIAGWLGRFRPH